jgi:predicted transcriptional regulator
MQAVSHPAEPTKEGTRSENADWGAVPMDSEELLEVLGDEYTITALRAVQREPKSVSAVAQQTDMSRTTAFRRLDRLEDFGLVEAIQRFDGNRGAGRCRVYRATADRIAIEFSESGFRVESAGEASERSTAGSSQSSAAD